MQSAKKMTAIILREHTSSQLGALNNVAETAARKFADCLQQEKLLSAGNLYKAAFILQHGETADDYLLALVLAVGSLAKGNADARWRAIISTASAEP